jgi:ribose 5-phosphate isomerase RpiB
MNGNNQARDGSPDGPVLRWPARVLTADDLRGHLNGHREVVLGPRAVVTPLAADELRANGVQVRREAVAEQPTSDGAWSFAQERAHPLIGSVVQSLRREGLSLKELAGAGEASPCRWARDVAECVARGECEGGVIFCQDAGLVCCVANKVAGLRAVSIVTVAQAARAARSLGVNLAAVEMPGRTFYEVRQILRTLCTPAASACPPGVAGTLQELDGHAHR